MTDESRLLDWFRPFERVVVAFSGGLDSSTLLAAGMRAKATTASLSITACYTGGVLSPTGEEAEVKRVAAETGAPLILLRAEELTDSDIVRNDPFRCYFCKKRKLGEIIKYIRNTDEKNISVLVDGSNRDDCSDWRPGTRAKEELGVRSPLAELGFTKDRIRHLASRWNLSVAGKPSSPCLASRIAYGIPLTCDRLEQVDHAEVFLAGLGYSPVRFRILAARLARIEVAAAEVPNLMARDRVEKITDHLCKLGFDQVEIDPEGFVSGKLNRGHIPVSFPAGRK